MDLSEHLLAFWKAPDFHEIGKTGRLAHAEAILEDAVEAMVESRNGDGHELERLKTFNHRDFVEHVWKICGLRAKTKKRGNDTS